MKYSFHPHELNNWKRRITERLVQCYIHEVLELKLKKEGFDLVLFKKPRFLPFGYIERALVRGEEIIDWAEEYTKRVMSDSLINTNTGEEITYNRGEEPNERLVMAWKVGKIQDVQLISNRVRELYLEEGVFPDTELFERNIKLFSLLNVATDGLLFKLNKTGKTISKRKALSGLFDQNYKDLPPKIPLVSGKIEVIEIKSDKAFIVPSQKEAYNIILKSGYKLRYFHVFIISFTENQFDIEETLIYNVYDLKEAIKHLRNVSRKNKVYGSTSTRDVIQVKLG